METRDAAPAAGASRGIRAVLLSGAAVLIRASDKFTLLASETQRSLRGLMEEARSRARARAGEERTREKPPATSPDEQGAELAPGGAAEHRGARRRAKKRGSR